MLAGAVEIQMLADLARLKADMAEAKGIVGTTMGEITSNVDKAKKAFGMLGIGISVAGLISMASGVLEAAEALHDLSIRTGLSVEALSHFQTIGRTSGTTAEEVAAAVNKMGKNLALASTDTNAARQALSALGLDYNKFMALSPDEKTLALAQAFNKFEDGTTKSAAAMILLGKGGDKLLPFFKDLAEAGKINAAITAEQAALADEFNDSITALGGQVKDTGMRLAVELIPTLQKLSGLFKLAAEVAAAYFAIFVAGPPIVAALVTAFNAFAVAVYEGATASSVLADSLAVTKASVASMLTPMGALGAAAAVLAGAFIGWELGKWAYENFSQVRLLGNAMVEMFMIAAERVKQLGSIMGEVFTFLTTDQSWKKTTENLKANNDQTTKNIAGIKAITAEMDVEAVQAFRTNVTLKEQKDTLVLNADASKAKADADKKAAAEAKKLADEHAKLLQSYLTLADATAAAIAQKAYELDGGAKLTQSEKDYIKVMSDVRDGKVKLTELEANGTLARLKANMVAEAANALTEVETKLLADVQKARDAATAALQKQTEGMVADNEKLAEQNLQLGMSKQAYELRGIEMLRNAADAKELNAYMLELNGADAEQVRQLKLQAAALRERAGLREDGIVVQEAKDAADAWAKTTDQIGQGLTDSLFRAFESGKDFFTTLWQGIVNTFKTTVLRPVIQAVMSPITGAIGAGLFGTSAAGAATGGAVSGAGGGLLGGLLGSIGGASSLFGSSALASLTGGIGVTGDLLGAAGAAISNGSILGGASIGAGAIAPYVAGAYLAYTLLAQKKGGPKVSGSAGTGNAVRNADSGGLDAEMQAMLAGTTSSYNAYAKGLGVSQSTIDATRWGYYASMDPQGTAGTNLLVQSSIGGKSIYDRGMGAFDAGRTEAELKTALVERTSAAILATLKASGIAPEALAYLDANSALTSTSEGLNKVLATLVDVRTATEAIAPLGGVFANIAGLSVDARSQLLGFAGGIEAFLSKTTAFVQTYYSEAEQAALQAASIRKVLTGAGLSADIGSKDALRALVDSRDVSTEAGRQQLAALLDVAAGFADISTYLATSGQTLEQLAAEAPKVTALQQLLEPGNPTADAVVTVNDTIEVGNSLLQKIVDATLEGIAATKAGLAGVGQQLAASNQIAQDTYRGIADLVSGGSLVGAAPSYSYDIGGIPGQAERP